VLTVRDDELAVGDNDNMLLEVAKGGARVGVPYMDGQCTTQQAGSSQPALQGTVGTKT